MEELAPTAPVAPDVADPQFWADLRRLVEERVVSDYEWYRSHADRPRILHRLSGTLVILFSVSIPLVAALEFTGDHLVLSILSLVIAALTGLNAFFRPESAWQSRRRTQFALAHLLSLHDLRMLEARHESDPERARGMALTATRELLEQAGAATGAETDEFFSRVRWPQVERG